MSKTGKEVDCRKYPYRRVYKNVLHELCRQSREIKLVSVRRVLFAGGKHSGRPASETREEKVLQLYCLIRGFCNLWKAAAPVLEKPLRSVWPLPLPLVGGFILRGKECVKKQYSS